MKGSSREEFFLLFPYDRDGEPTKRSLHEEAVPQGLEVPSGEQGRARGPRGREVRGDDWYRFGRQQGYGVAALPKVLVPSLMREPVAIPDPEGALAFTASGKGGGGAWGLVPKDGVALEDLVAVLKSPGRMGPLQGLRIAPTGRMAGR